MQCYQRVGKVLIIQVPAFKVMAGKNAFSVTPSACCACFSNGRPHGD